MIMPIRFADPTVTPAPAVGSDQHPIVRSIVLHLLPGALATLAFVTLAPVVMRAGFPPLMAMVLAALLVVVPFELGVVLLAGWRRSGSIGLSAVQYRERLSWRQYALLVPLLFVGSNLVAAPAALLAPQIIANLFGWLPSWFVFADVTQYVAYDRSALIITMIAVMIVIVVIAPIVEEIYFRGYLLPRLGRFGAFAPIINVVLFAVYHFWQPYAVLTIVLAMLPLAYVAQRTRNIYVGMIVHCLTNLIGNGLLFAVVLNGGT